VATDRAVRMGDGTIEEGAVVGKRFPRDRPLLGGDITHRLLPIDFYQGDRGRLDGALDEKTRSIAALGCTGDFASMPEEIIAFSTDKALARSFAAGCWGEGGIDIEPAKCAADPGMDTFITLGGTKRIPGVRGRKAECVGPVRVMRYQPASRGAPDEGAELGKTFHILKALEIAK
jgi:hypothetical protein